MKLEFLEGGSPDCPLIRLHEFNAKEAYHLRRTALQLARGWEPTVFFHEQPGVISIGGCQLALHQGEKNHGVSELGSLKFKWVLSKAGWLQVAGLIRPFSRGAMKGWQWLSETGKAKLLFFT
jgi:hypothetical protein